MKFSFDCPEPSVAFEGFEFSFRVFTQENAYSLSADHLTVRSSDNGLEIRCGELTWAGGQQRAPGRVTARLTRRGDAVECEADVEMERPIKAVAMILRGVPRGRLSAAGAPFSIRATTRCCSAIRSRAATSSGLRAMSGMTTPLVLVQAAEGHIVALSSLDDRVRPKRFYFQPGERRLSRRGDRTSTKAGIRRIAGAVPAWRIARATTIAEAAAPHFAHIERVFACHVGHARRRAGLDAPHGARRHAARHALHRLHVQRLRADARRSCAGWRRGSRRNACWCSSRRGTAATTGTIRLYAASDRMGGEAGFRRSSAKGRRSASG